MSQLLILGTTILAIGPLIDTGVSIQCPDIIYPKSTIPGYEIQVVALPSDFTIQTYKWISGALVKNAVVAPPITVAQSSANYIAMMQSRVDALNAKGDFLEAYLLQRTFK